MVNVPFVFGLGFFLRIFVPGFVASLLLAVFRDQLFLFRGLEGITLFLLLSGLLGLALRLLTPFVGEFLVGTNWPSMVRIPKVRALERRLRQAEEILKQPPKDVHSREGSKYLQAGRYVLLFPIDQFGKRSVAAPTLFGNIVASFLSYLALQYGLAFLSSRAFERHMTYVITRLWFALPREIRQEVSDSFAESEALMGSWAAVSLGGIAFFGKGVVLAVRDSWAASRTPFVAVLLLFALGWLLLQAIQRQAITVATIYEALLGYLSRSQVDGIIEEANKTMAAQAKGTPTQTPMGAETQRESRASSVEGPNGGV